MLTLLTYPAGFGTLSLSPFCIKAMYLLNMSGQAWKREDTHDPRRMPHAKLPVLRTEHGLIPDSDGIRAYLEDQGANFWADLSDQEKAHGRALIRMAEEHLYFLLVLDRWERDEVWPVIRETYFKEIPRLLRGPITSGLRKTLMKGLRAQGLGRLSWDERMHRLEQDLWTLSTQLGGNPFLFGDTPTLADYSIVPILDCMMATPVSTPLSQRISEDDHLRSYVQRVAQIGSGT